jgi:hypothetical protein
MSNAKRIKISNLTPFQFLAGQVSEISPVNMIIALSGLIYLLFHRSAKPFRIFGWIFLTVYLVLAVQKSKPYYMNPDYFVLMAAGGWAVESFIQRHRMNWIRPVVLILVVFFGAISAPFAIPILHVEDFIAYQKFLGANPPQQERHTMGILPQFFADRFGWENMVKTVTSVYNTLTPEQKDECTIYATNYGEAGAINYYGRRWGLPHAISEHNNYYLWGYGRATGKVIITVGIHPDDWKSEYESVVLAATVVSPYAMPYENNLPVCICLGLKLPIEKAWGPPHYI